MASWSAVDKGHMNRALALARRGSGFTSPNPLVGALVAQGSEVVGSGWHRQAGEPHAEVEAIRSAGARAKGATLYVTLEPCNHFGKTPPCTDAIVSAGISRVIVAMRDPNPSVRGGGIAALRERGVSVSVGLAGEHATEINRGWIHWITHGQPFVLLKLAASLDGKIATASGESKWISSSASRAHVQRLRRHVDAILVGSGTVLADNPRLTNRTGIGPQPLRVVVDSSLQTSIDAHVFRPLALGQRGRTPISVVATTSAASFERRRDRELAGIDVVSFEGDDGRVDLDALLTHLGAQGIQSVMCEGGAALATALLSRGFVHRLMLYQAPIVLGQEACAWFEHSGSPSVQGAPRFSLLRSRRVGPDSLLLYKVSEPTLAHLYEEEA